MQLLLHGLSSFLLFDFSEDSMPRIKNLVDFSTESGSSYNRPTETLIEVPTNDSIETLTIHIEPKNYIQIKKEVDGDTVTWRVYTNLNTVIVQRGAILAKG